MIKVRCRDCNNEVSEGKSCGCPNMVMVKGDIVTALDLTRTVMVESHQTNKEGLSSQDLAWQEQRRKRKVRKLDFEIR